MLCMIITLISMTYCRQCYSNNQVPVNFNHDMLNGSDCQPCYYRCTQCTNTFLTGCNTNSCEQGYYYSANGTCESCSYNCQSCSSSSECLSCFDGYYLVGKVCSPCSTGTSVCSISAIVSCLTGYFYESSRLQCTACITNCRICQNIRSCDYCLSGLYYQSSNNSCIVCTGNCTVCSGATTCSDCYPGFAVANDGSCRQFNCTVASCLECPINTSQCTLCQSGFYTKNYQCIAGTSLLCGLARGPDFGSCASCSNDSTQPKDTATYCIVPPANSIVSYLYLTATNNPEYFGSTITTSKLCDHILTTPQSSYTINVLIPPSYQIELMMQLVHFIAGSNFTYSVYPLPSSNTTVEMTSLWDSQQVATEVCDNRSKLFVRSKIVLQVRALYNQIKLIGSEPFSVMELMLKFSLCQTPNCSICSSTTKCTSCIPPRLLLRGGCVASCDSGYYTDVVHRSCVYACPTGLYLDPPTYQCLQCLSPCSTCASLTTCLTCVNSTFLYNSSCLGVCSSNTTFGNPTTGKCQRCLNPCLTCTGSGSNCTSCSAGYLLVANQSGSCLGECPSGTYAKFAGSLASCELCSSNCTACTLNANSCTSCPVGKYLFGSNCIDNCPSGYYGNQQLWSCIACNQPCAACTNTSSNCSSCTMGTLIVTIVDGTTYGKCESMCPTGKYSSSSMDCVSCSMGCMVCSNATYCLSCTNVTTTSSKGTTVTEIYYLESNMCRTTCTTGFMDNSTNMCSSCKYPCNTCLQDYVGNVCLSCHAGLFLQQQTCVQVCSSSNYRSSNETCLPCSSSCLTCTNAASCASCRPMNATTVDLASPTLLFVFKNGNCLNKTGCSYSQFIATNISTGSYFCSRCDASCLTCISYSTNCLSCSPQLLLSGNQCVSQCAQGYFNLSNNCAICRSQCKSCTGSLVSNCQACNSPYYLLSTNCVVTCTSGYYGNSVTSTCQACPSGCQTCVNQYSCTSCSVVNAQQYYLLNSRCIQNCPIGTVNSSSPISQCILCSSTCLTCSIVADNCTSCPSGLFLQSGTVNNTKTCSLTCPLKQYPDSMTMSCQACQSPCSTCVSLRQCITCINSTNVATQTFFYQKSCLLACPDTTFPNTTSLLCQNCSYPCRTCTSQLCLSCRSGLFMNISQCVVQCADGYYGDNSTQLCVACSPPCLFCSGSTLCTSCQQGYSLKNGVCLNSCPKGTFPNDLTGQCITCSASCEKCAVSATRCTSCTLPLNLNPIDYNCVALCPSGYYPQLNSNFRYECQLCSTLCGNCTNFTKCTSCRSPLLLQNNQCLPNCSSHYFPSNGVCMNCSIDCANCSDEYICFSCTSLFLSNYSCVADCPRGSYRHYPLRACVQCSAYCSECTTSTNCSKCSDGYAVLSGFCVRLPCRYPYYSRPETSSCLLQCLPDDYQSNRTCFSQCPSWLITRIETRQCVQNCQPNEFINNNIQCESCQDSSCSNRSFNFTVIYIPKANELDVLVIFSKAFVRSLDVPSFMIQLVGQQPTRQLASPSANQSDDSRILSISFNPGTSLRNQELVVSLVSYNSGYSDQSGNVLQNYQSTLKVSSYDYYQNKGTPALAIILIIVVFVFTVTLIYLQQHHLIWDAFDYCQLFYFACLLPVQLPPSIDEFLAAFSIANLKFSVGGPVINNSPYKYYQYTTDVNFLRNVACDLVVIAAVGLIIGLAGILNRFKEKIKSQWIIKIVDLIWSNKYLIGLEIYLLTSLNAGLFSFAQLYDTSTQNDSFLRFNMLCTCFGIIVTLGSPLAICGWLYRQLLQKVKDSEPQHCFFKGLNMSKVEIGLMFNGFRVLRRVIWVILIGLYPLNEVYGLSAMLLTSATLISVLAMYRPYLDELRNSLALAQEAILLGVFSTMLLLVLNKGDNTNGKLALGAVVQVQCFALVILSLVVPGMQIYRSMKEKFSRRDNEQNEQRWSERVPDAEGGNGQKANQQLQQPAMASIKVLMNEPIARLDQPVLCNSRHERMSSDGSMMEVSSAEIRSRKFKVYEPSESQFPKSD